ncbi:3-deoxy-D-manno-octulosonic acid transferase [Maribacter hydrothermalis]|uniref:3-deoxy-D-manno-octulosonic acid transferase n=1 Tax=Maribacter hydrothermalis TaxID=1836467 RepID=A0A1B7ZFA9_9FLAO|nr:glycosyltransferase N-terminal domain-containing protein [Maribacter hydrothermalis]APQ17785.1 3-deoxy-D-manno-octulosonic acid transferase [Maribacter hydrothermalis]OBR42259.1 3-deoxy-D-manno-octulosonic acid transferase [Maribacter hydrothermalis]
MYFLYNLLALSASFVIKVLSLINPKLSLFVKGRKETFSIIKKSISIKDKVIWIHAASLGEYEQGLPVMEKLKIEYPLHKIVLTFFSPSGYEVKKNSTVADSICYLPLDTKQNVRLFLDAVHPEMAIFIKYEVWPNYLAALKTNDIPTFLVSAIFKENQIYFKWYGSFMRKALLNFTHIFVQNKKSSSLLKSIGVHNVSISGDTRFDRVSEILERDNSLDFMNHFKNDMFCLVAGSTWPEDEKLIIDYINQNTHHIKFVFAPHTIKTKHINTIIQAINKPVLCYSELDVKKPEGYDVLLIDTIGLLTKIYSYADVAYVGGGFATGLHNTLEPAIFGIPVIIGPNFDGFVEAEELVQLKGVISIKDSTEFKDKLNLCFVDATHRQKSGQINYSYIKAKEGATEKIMTVINSFFRYKI